MVFLSVLLLGGAAVLLVLGAAWRWHGSMRPLVVALHGAALIAILLSISANGLVFDAKTYLGDLWTALEAINKAAQGTRSSSDYINPVGPVQQWIYMLAVLARGATPAALPMANGLVGLLVWGATWLLLRRRASPLALALVALCAVLTALSPRDIDALLAEAQTSFLAPYNRWAWAMMIPLAARAGLPWSSRDIAGAIGAGFAVAFLLLLKVTYGAAAIGLIGAAAVVDRRGWRDPLIVAAVSVAAILFASLITSGQIAAYFADLRGAALLANNGLRPQRALADLGEVAFVLGGSLLILWMAAPAGPDGRTPRWRWFVRPVLLIGAVAGAGWAVLVQNHYLTEAGTYLLLPLLAAEWSGLLAGWARPDRGDGRLRLGLQFLVLIAILFRPVMDGGFLLAERLNLVRMARDPNLAGTGLAALVVHPRLRQAEGICTGACQDYRLVLSGRELIQRACPKARPTVLAGSFGNPFPMLLHARSPRASLFWFHAGRTFSPEYHPAPERLFADVDCYIVDKHEENAAMMTQIYGGYVASHFRKAGENDLWELWAR